MTDTPIEPQDYISGVKVVDIGDLRVARGLTRRPASSCKHKQLVYDERERRIWCQHCETSVDPFDAFVRLVEQWKGAVDDAQRDRDAAREALAHAARHRATKVLDKAWGSRTMVPTCPHCHAGLFPEDFTSGIAMAGKEYARALIAKRDGRKP